MKRRVENTTYRVLASPRTKPADIRLDELMSSAEKLFLSRGVDSTTINDIVLEAGVAKGTFYHYFVSKNDMLDALAKRYTSQFLTRVQNAVDVCSPDDWSERLRVWIHANVEAYAETYRTHDMVYTNHHQHNRDNEARNVILAQLLDIIEGGCSAGVWTARQPRVVALLIYSGVHGATDDLIASKAADRSSFSRNLSEACLRLLPPPERSAD